MAAMPNRRLETYSASRSKSVRPMTGFYRGGCCDTGQEDVGSHTVCGDNCSVSRFFKILWQRSFDTGTGIRFSWTEAPATLVLMCVPLAGSI